MDGEREDPARWAIRGERLTALPTQGDKNNYISGGSGNVMSQKGKMVKNRSKQR